VVRPAHKNTFLCTANCGQLDKLIAIPDLGQPSKWSSQPMARPTQVQARTQQGQLMANPAHGLTIPWPAQSIKTFLCTANHGQPDHGQTRPWPSEQMVISAHKPSSPSPSQHIGQLMANPAQGQAVHGQASPWSAQLMASPDKGQNSSWPVDPLPY
jgi:hypothetical protein